MNEERRKKLFMKVRWGVRLMPTLLMLGHWFLAATLHKSPHGMPLHAGYSGALVASIWFMVWAFPMISLWCAGRLFGFGTLWKLPFGYAAGAIAVRLAHGTLFASEWTAAADSILVALTLAVYGFVIVGKMAKK